MADYNKLMPDIERTYKLQQALYNTRDDNEAKIYKAAQDYSYGDASKDMVMPRLKDYTDISGYQGLSGIKDPNLNDLNYYANNFGLDTSVADLRNKFDAATKAEYETKNREYKTSEDEYYKNMVAENSKYNTALNQATSEALKNGSSRGMQFANQFAAANQISQANGTGALDLAHSRNNLKAKEAEAYTNNAVNADSTIRDLKNQIMQQAVTQYASDVQNHVGDLSARVQENTNAMNTYNNNLNTLYNIGSNIANNGTDISGNLIKAISDNNVATSNKEADIIGKGMDYDTNLDGIDLKGKYDLAAAEAAAARYGGSGGGYYGGGQSSYNKGNSTGGKTYTNSNGDSVSATEYYNEYYNAIKAGDFKTAAMLYSQHPEICDPNWDGSSKNQKQLKGMYRVNDKTYTAIERHNTNVDKAQVANDLINRANEDTYVFGKK